MPLARFCHQKREPKKKWSYDSPGHQIHSYPGIVHPKFWRVTAVMRRLTCGPWVVFSSCCCLEIHPSMAVIAKREARTIIGFSIGCCESKAIKLPKQISKTQCYVWMISPIRNDQKSFKTLLKKIFSSQTDHLQTLVSGSSSRNPTQIIQNQEPKRKTRNLGRTLLHGWLGGRLPGSQRSDRSAAKGGAQPTSFC